MQDIFETLDNQGATYEDAVTQLKNYFKSRENIAFERHIFHKSRQSADETIDNNYTITISEVM